MSTALLFVVWTLGLAHPSTRPTGQDEMAGGQTWTAEALELCSQSQDLAGEVAKLRARLVSEGYPKEQEDPDGVRRAVWFLKAAQDRRERYVSLLGKERLLRRNMLQIYVCSSIGDPVLRRTPDALLVDAGSILQEYVALLRKVKDKPFEAVFFDQVDSNIKALGGDYYRQATIVLCAHVATSFAYDTLFELEELGPASRAQQDWLLRTFSRWRFVDLAYGYRWSRDGGVPRLRPEKREAFDLIEVKYKLGSVTDKEE